MQVMSAQRGWGWIVAGWQLMKTRLSLAIGVVLLMYVLLFVASMLPYIGNILTPFLSPFLAGGVYVVFAKMRTIEQREQIEPLAREQPIAFDLMFSVFQDSAPRKALINLALVSLAFTFLMLLLMAVFVAVQLSGIDHAVLTDPTATDEQRMAFLLPILLEPSAGVIWLIGLVGVAIYSMATFFAVPLIVLRGLSVAPALKQSFQAVARHWLAFLVYGVAWLLLFISVPLTLMLSLIILLPLMFASVFVAFEEIWPAVDGSVQPKSEQPATRISTVM